ncbi:MAG: asparagine N-glycosylation enzyme membrane subunit Stt3 [Candidatus Woesearchaeota archaeon]|jgi:asparagine N-glycosylation enzyme membrane subunit Stt3
MNKKLTKYILVFLILLSLVFTMMFAYQIRTGTVHLDGIEDSVYDSVLGQVHGIILDDVIRDNPFSSNGQLVTLAEQKMNEVVKKGVYTNTYGTIYLQEEIDTQIVNLREGFQDSHGQTYLIGIDPYFFMNNGINYAKNGHIGDALVDIDGEMYPINTKRLAPTGVIEVDKPTFHIWILSKLLTFNDITQDSNLDEKMAAIFLLPALLGAFTIIPAFFLIRKFSNTTFAVIGCIILTASPMYLLRTVAGFVDTDGYQVLFSLLIVCSIIFSFSSKSKFISYMFAILAGLFQGLYVWSWQPGRVIMVAIVGSLVLYIIAKAISEQWFNEKSFRKLRKLRFELYLSLTYILSTIIFTKIFAGTFIFRNIISDVNYIQINLIAKGSHRIWPNVLSSVKELQSGSFSEIIMQSGGQIIFVVALLGIMLVALQFKSKSRTYSIAKICIGIIGTIWFYIFTTTTNSMGSFVDGVAQQSPLVFLVLLFIPIGASLLLSIGNGRVNIHTLLAIILSMLFAQTIYMSLIGIRFVIFLAPVIGIAFALGLFIVCKTTANWLASSLEIKQTQKESYGLIALFGFIAACIGIISLTTSITYFLFWSLLIIVLGSVLFFVLKKPLKIATETATAKITMFTSILGILFVVFILCTSLGPSLTLSQEVYPEFDDEWVAAMNKIQNDSTPDAIITSSWDFGHFYVAVSNRGVTFDGASQTNAPSHWVGKLLLENDENVSFDILRMLNCGGNEAFDYLLSVTKDPSSGVVVNQLLSETFGVEDKRSVLEDTELFTFTDDEISSIIEKLSCENPPPNYLITSSNQVANAPIWAHWGLWSFEKKHVLSNHKVQTVSQMATDLKMEEQVVQTYVDELKTQSSKKEFQNQWLAPYPEFLEYSEGFYTGCDFVNTTIYCSNGIEFDLESQTIISQDPIVKVRRVFISNSSTVTEIEIDVGGNYDVLFIPTNTGYQSVLGTYPLGGSLFSQMYFFDGVELEHFSKFDDRQTVNEMRITTWKTDWD